MHDLFVDFGLYGGEVLIFRYCKSDCFKVYIIGSDCGESEYPPIVHSSQKSSPKTGNMKFIMKDHNFGCFIYLFI